MGAGLYNRQAVADQNTFLDKGTRCEKLALLFQPVHVFQVFGDKSQHLILGSNALVQGSKEPLPDNQHAHSG